MTYRYHCSIPAESGHNTLPFNPCRLLDFTLLKLEAGQSWSGESGDRRAERTGPRTAGHHLDRHRAEAGAPLRGVWACPRAHTPPGPRAGYRTERKCRVRRTTSAAASAS